MGQVMTGNAEIPHKKTKKSITIWVLSAISLVYIGIVYLLIKETETCAGTAVSANWFKGFWDQYLGCRSVNELGDTLSGAFAPVAFLWLMGAVFIQSQELKAQREELDETQEVMRAQLQVSLQQVEETRASTELFRKQTEILERDQRLRDQKSADEEFDKILEAIQMFIRKETKQGDLILSRIQPVTRDDAKPWALIAYNLKENNTFPFHGDYAASDLWLTLSQHYKNLNRWLREYDDDYYVSDWSGGFALEILTDHLNALIRLEDRLSEAYKTKFYVMDFESTLDDIHDLLKKIEQSREKAPNDHTGFPVVDASGSTPE